MNDTMDASSETARYQSATLSFRPAVNQFRNVFLTVTIFIHLESPIYEKLTKGIRKFEKTKITSQVQFSWTTSPKYFVAVLRWINPTEGYNDELPPRKKTSTGSEVYNKTSSSDKRLRNKQKNRTLIEQVCGTMKFVRNRGSWLGLFTRFLQR